VKELKLVEVDRVEEWKIEKILYRKKRRTWKIQRS